MKAIKRSVQNDDNDCCSYNEDDYGEPEYKVNDGRNKYKGIPRSYL